MTSAQLLASILGTLLGGTIGLLFVLGAVGAIFAWPFMLWSIMRNVKGVRVQLERLNDTFERGTGENRPSPVTSTGSLNLSPATSRLGVAATQSPFPR